MFKSLGSKFLIVQLTVVVIALSSALFLQELMLRDFNAYLEGEMEDRVYWVTADLEATHEKYSGWNEEVVGEDAIWAFLLGLETRILDRDGRLIMDTGKALNRVSPSIQKKVLSILKFKTVQKERYFPYPLFLKGKEIGKLEVRFMRPKKEAVFIQRSNRFLLFISFILGGLAVFLSLLFSKRLTNSLKGLAQAAKAVTEGDLKVRVPSQGRDEIARLSKTFNRMGDVLGMQESLRKRLISNIAHELRTPIGAMRGELEGMMDGLIPVNKESIQSIYEETGRLRNILEGIEELSQAQASALWLKKESIKLKPFLEFLMERFGALFQEKQIRFEIHCPDNLTIMADPDRLGQVMVNHLSNALKATGQGGQIMVEARSHDSEVMILVKDSGAGIRDQDLPFIFERFYRASEGGLGLGLAIVKELVEAHGGRITAESKVGLGSVFTVTIPQ